MKTIIYVHDFGVSGEGSKAKIFRDYFKDKKFLTPSLSYIPERAIKILEEIIECYDGDVDLIGSLQLVGDVDFKKRHFQHLNPMSDEYIERMDKKRVKLGFLPLSQNGYAQDSEDALQYCKQLLAGEIVYKEIDNG